MKKILCFTLLLFSYIHGNGQCPQFLVIQSQQQIDDFASNYPNCTELTDPLIITGLNSEIDDLSGLGQITKTKSHLSIRNTNLVNFDGFGPIEFLGMAGKLDIENNPLLTSICGFSGSMDYFGLTVFNNPKLESLNPLYGLTTMYYAVIAENEKLESLSGLETIQVSNQVVISDNDLLNDLEGLGLSGTLNEYLVISNNDSLQNLSGLDNFEGTYEELYISGNPVLQDISALANIDPTTVGHWIVKDNLELEECSVLCEYLNIDGLATIENNLTGCNSEQEVEASCLLNVPDFNIDSLYSIFPNPASTEIKIVTKGMGFAGASIYSASGKKVLSTPKTSIDISNFSAGVYFVEITDAQASTVKKIIKK